MNPRVVIVGGGFGGLSAVRKLAGAQVDITLIDRANHHLFQPLLYQVATAGLAPSNIATPIRSILRRQRNVDVVMAEVESIDMAHRIVRAENSEFPFDFLVLATGANQSYFAHPEWEQFAPGLKSVEDATQLRRRVLIAFEQAEIEKNPEVQKAFLTFVLVGGGPTGVELAGSIADLSRKGLKRDFRHVDPTQARIILIEAGSRVLAGFPPQLSAQAQKCLTKLGVEVRTGIRVEHIDERGVTFGGERISSRTVIWAAGVTASPAAKWLGAEMDRAGRVKVRSDLSVPGHAHIFVIGDTASFIQAGQDGHPLPGVAPVAMQQGRYVARVIRAKLSSKREIEPFRYPFRYNDKGNLATVGRTFAVADVRGFQLSGFVAWMAWIVVHIFYLIGFRNRVLVLIEWAWAYLTFRRGARLITRPVGT